MYQATPYKTSVLLDMIIQNNPSAINLQLFQLGAFDGTMPMTGAGLVNHISSIRTDRASIVATVVDVADVPISAVGLHGQELLRLSNEYGSWRNVLINQITAELTIANTSSSPNEVEINADLIALQAKLTAFLNRPSVKYVSYAIFGIGLFVTIRAIINLLNKTL